MVATAQRENLFAQIKPTRRVRPRRVLIYGVQGVGKSTFASKAPNPIFLPTEEGLDNMDAQAFPRLRTWSEFQEALTALDTNEHDYQTVVIDSLDKLEELIWAQVCTDHKAKSIEEIEYGKGYMAALTYWNWALSGLEYLRDQKNMWAILIAHSQIQRFEAPDKPAYDRYCPRLHKAAAPRIQEWCDEVFFATWEVFVKTTKGGFGKEKGQAVGTGNRIMRTTEQPFCAAKNRLDTGSTPIPEHIPLSWEAYAAFLPKA